MDTDTQIEKQAPVTAVTRFVTTSGEDRVREFVRASKAASTVRGYQSDWMHFSAWCEARKVTSLPAYPPDVAIYISECAEWLTAGSIQRRLNAIAEAHKATGRESPTQAGIVKNTFKGIKRTIGTAPAKQKAPALTEDIRAMIREVDDSAIGVRDRALILVGFAGAFRRSELVSLDVGDLDFGNNGLTILLRRSKTDQEGAGRKVGIPHGVNADTCPVRATQDWLKTSAIASGPLFRSVTRLGKVKAQRLSAIDVARTVKKLAERVGLDPKNYAGHSLRSGHATSAADAGVPEREIMNQTGHRSVEMVRRYIRDANLFKGNSGGKVGL